MFHWLDHRGSPETGLAITPQTPIPNWLGESMDSSIVVHNLLLRDGKRN